MNTSLPAPNGLSDRVGPEASQTNGETSPPDAAFGERCEFIAYHEIVKHGQTSTEPASDPFGRYDSGSQDGAYALVIRRRFQENEPSRTALQVNSPFIRKAFREVIKSYVAVPSDFTSTVELHSPFGMLVHYWDELEAYRRLATDVIEREHLGLLFEFMEHEVKPQRERALKMIQKCQIAYDNAWIIYRPGDVMYVEVEGHPWLMVCRKTAYEVDHVSGPYFEVCCSYTDDSGVTTGQAEHIIVMNQRAKFPAGSAVLITDLDVYPRTFAREGDSLEARLKVRGEKFLLLKDTTTVAYDGAAEWLKEPPYDYYDPSRCKFRGVWLPYTETGRVVLDRKTFGEELPLGAARVKKSDPDPVQCPPFTLGYSLGRKQWCRFFVDNIRDVEWSPNAWDSLVLLEKEKHLLRALISSHAYSKNPRESMQQKGKGLVILLHGTPGSGKTLTAETAAEGSRKALVSTSVGDLNKGGNMLTGLASFEKELKKILQYATVWQAVVLIDEADVFLEARKDVGNSERNVLVAVLLRELEYFSGIVFLTTNRVNSFDVAMKSRIHLSLSYTPPETKVRRSIWRKCLETVLADVNEVDMPETLSLLAAVELNGREIANSVNTAKTLARFDEAPLKLGHILMVLEVRQTFDQSFRAATKTP
ncbi:P-loop containing nucleoside triphosphate hydrolase protein [Durotheca rogersii]|uniref:P-loop containing nucleoside triphosphate hydrolase protein n=1 Tax=Durotheca rogersii TaxID=419775 RepID=UPI0022204375|nr:P-loop containing nucleoside triphosphate hydrolase protein [Durotheca rogersii]KAI5866491.1 P-loop containing nucleoside triphosphate hydrolase protein [Durotheca rogersii]